LAYAIGVAEPVSVAVETFGTGKVSEEVLVAAVRKNFDMTPKGMIETLKLRRPVFRKTSYYGHFGRTGDSFTWEATDKAEALKSAVAAHA
jgi:S-adenosylmethionine synthetase